MGSQLQMLYSLEGINGVGRILGKKSKNARNKIEVQKEFSTWMIVTRIRDSQRQI